MNDNNQTKRAALVDAQLGKLNQLLAELYGKNAFYTTKLNESGITLPVRSLDAFSAKMPFTIKQELVDDQQAKPPYGTNVTYPLSAYTRFHQTSGTTRKPLRWLDDERSWLWMRETWKKVLLAAEVTPEDRIFFAFSFGPFIGFWSAFAAAESLGCLCIPGGGMSSLARLQTMRDSDATVLNCTPTYAMRLAEAAKEHHFDLSSLHIKKIIVGGEPGAGLHSTRQRIESAWNGARLFDHHGMTEVGPVTYETVASPGYLHADESAFFVEVLHPETDKAVENGDTGELVLTTLGRIGMPLLRYRTNDLVKPDWSGKPKFSVDDVAFAGGITGRLDDMVVVRGVNLFPTAVEDIIRSFTDVVEYQVKIHQEQTLTEVIIEIEAADHCQDAASLAKWIEGAFRDAFHLRIPVTVMPSGSLPRYEMKAKRWIRI